MTIMLMGDGEEFELDMYQIRQLAKEILKLFRKSKDSQKSAKFEV